MACGSTSPSPLAPEVDEYFGGGDQIKAYAECPFLPLVAVGYAQPQVDDRDMDPHVKAGATQLGHLC